MRKRADVDSATIRTPPRHEPQPRPRRIDRRDLVVHQPRAESLLPNIVLRDVGCDTGRLLRPRDPHAPTLRHDALGDRQPPVEIGARFHEEHHEIGLPAGLAFELCAFGQRSQCFFESGRCTEQRNHGTRFDAEFLW